MQTNAIELKWSFLVFLAAVLLPACAVEAGDTDDPAEEATQAEGSLEAACPKLAGTYTCPAFRGAPEYTLKVYEKPRTNGTLYTFYYSFLDNEPGLKVLANASGVAESGYVAQCIPYGGRATLLVYPVGGDPVTQGSYGFINANNDYQTDFGGAPASVCERN